MSVVICADAEPQPTRLDFWQHVISERLGAVDVEVPDGLDGGDQLVISEAELVADADFALAAGVGAGAEPSLWRDVLVERGMQ